MDVLLVEDDPGDALIVREAFEHYKIRNTLHVSGMEVLAELKADPDLRVIPVVILTTSRSDEDVLRSYSLHANAYVSKPVELEAFMGAVREIGSFFVLVVRLPNG